MSSIVVFYFVVFAFQMLGCVFIIKIEHPLLKKTDAVTITESFH